MLGSQSSVQEEAGVVERKGWSAKNNISNGTNAVHVVAEDADNERKAKIMII